MFVFLFPLCSHIFTHDLGRKYQVVYTIILVKIYKVWTILPVVYTVMLRHSNLVEDYEMKPLQLRVHTCPPKA
jgi:hypothetical protein